MEISLNAKVERTWTGEGLAERWGPLMIAVCGAFMAAIGWMKWGDLMIDYGAQVYLPWQISEGRVLYRDLFYLYGPLSSHVHAFLFSLFGPGIRVLILFNLFLVAVLAGLIFVLFRRLADALTATLCALTFVVVFALAQYQGSGNFNFLAPYNYDVTHGVFLGMVTLFLYEAYLRRGGVARLVALGLLTGLTFLTKPEAFLALFTAMLAGMPLAVFSREGSRRTKWLKLGLWMLAFLSTPLAFWMYLALHMPAGEALRGLIGPWLHVLDPFTRSLPLYQWIRGINDTGGNLLKMAGYALAWAAVLGLVYGLHRGLVNKVDAASRQAIGWAATALLVVAAWFSPVPWMELVRPLPLFVLGYGLYHLRSLKRTGPVSGTHSLFLVTFSIFAFVLMLKILLNVHVFHYGFVLTFPAFLLFIRFLVYEWPQRIPSGPGEFPFLRIAASALVLVFVAVHGHTSYRLYQLKNYQVGTGADALLDYYPFLNPRGEIFNEALNHIRQEMEPGAGFPVFPAGNMLNYMSRHANPFPFIFFTPPEVHFYGESAYLERLQARPPPYIVFVEMDNSWLGAHYFGKDYAQDLYAWIGNHYEESALFGERPFTGKGFGILFMKLKTETPE